MQPSYEKHNIEDYIGKKFGYLTVIGQSPKTNEYSNKFDFQCDCGNIISDEPHRVISGHRTSCGKCSFRKKDSKPRFDINEYLGKRENMLTVIGIADREPSDKCWKLLCQCDCGNTCKLTPYQFNQSKIKSCGCLRHIGRQTLDNRTKHPLYGTWKQMLNRCENPNAPNYSRYGKKGISVCDEWHDFWKFVEWSDSIGGKPKSYTLDRINGSLGYSPQNCRWADQNTQANNKSSSRYIEYNGVSKTIKQWAEELGLNHETLSNRISRGWSIEKALTAKLYTGNNKYLSK